MKKILTILLLLFVCFLSKAQSNGDPTGFPTLNSAPYYKYNGFLQIADNKGFLNSISDTNWHPRFAGTQIYKAADSSIYWWTGNIWVKAGSGSGGSQSWNDGMTISPDINSSYTSNFNSNDWSWNNVDVFTLNASSIIAPLSSQSNINYILTQNSSNSIFRSTFSSVADSLQPYLIQPISVSDVFYQFQDSTNTPPVSFPAGFDTTYWMIGGAGTGIFSGHNYEIALYVNGVFDSFIVPTVNDWGLTLDDNIYHQYDGATWPRRNAPPWLTNGSNVGGGVLSSSGNYDVFLRRNGVNRIRFSTAGTQFQQLTGASNGLMGLSTVGVASNVQIGTGLLLSGGVLSSTVSGTVTSVTATSPITSTGGTTPVISTSMSTNKLIGRSTAGTGVMEEITVGTGLSLSGGTLSSTVSGGITTADNGLNLSTATNVQLGGALLVPTTISGATTLTLSPSRTIISADDSISAIATNNITIGSVGGTASLLGTTVTAKGSTATFGSYTKSIFHYETGTGDSIALELKSTGARWVGISTFSTGTTGFKPLQQDTATGFMIRKLIDVSNNTAQITGVGNVANGFTGASTLTANNLIVGNGTSPVTFIAPSTSGNVLTSNGTTWVSQAATANYWTKAPYAALASTNILQPISIDDTLAMGSGMTTSVRAKYNFVGTMFLKGKIGINTTQDATYFLNIATASGSSLHSEGLNWLDGNTGINTAPSSTVANAIVASGNTVSAIVTTHTAATNGTSYISNNFSIQNAQTTAAGGHTVLQVSASNQTDASSNQTTALYRTIYAFIQTKSNSSTPITTAVTYDAFIGGNSGAGRVQTYTTAYGLRIQDIGANYPTGGMLTSGGNFYGVFIDSSLAASFAGGTMHGFYQRDNTALNIINQLQGKTSIGTLTAPTGLLMLGAGTTAIAPLVFTSGTDLTTGIDGAVNWDGSNLKIWDGTTKYTLDKSLTGSATLDFPSTLAQTDADLTITVTGAGDGDVVMLGVPNGSTLTGSCYTAWVSAANTVTVRFSVYGIAAKDPASGTFKVRIIQ